MTSKRQKTLMAVLAVLLLAMLADWSLRQSGSGGPRQASANIPAEQLHATVPSAPAAAPPQKISLMQRLKQLATTYRSDPTKIRDGFALPSSWLNAVRQADAPKAELSIPDRFVQTHHLTAVIVNGQQSTAQVNGVCLFIGDMIDQFKLVAVNQASAVFKSQAGTAVIELQNNAH